MSSMWILTWRARITDGDQFQVSGSNPDHGLYLLSRNLHQVRLSNGSDGQFKQNLAKQHCQICKQVQVVQVLCHHHLLYETWTLPSWLWEKDPGFWDQVPEETSPHLLLGALDQWLGAEQGQPPLDHRNHFWQLSREGNLHGLIMSCTMTASPRPFFKIKTFLIICSCFLLFS